MKRQREVWKGRRSLVRVGTLNIGTMKDETDGGWNRQDGTDGEEYRK